MSGVMMARALLEGAAQMDARARRRAEQARAELKAAAVGAVRDGLSPTEVARIAGISRVTVHAWVNEVREAGV